MENPVDILNVAIGLFAIFVPCAIIASGVLVVITEARDRREEAAYRARNAAKFQKVNNTRWGQK